MSKKKNKNKAARRNKASGGGGQAAEPIKVNWWVVGGAVVIVAVLVFYSISQQQKPAAAITATATTSAGAGAGATDCSNGPTSKQYASAPAMAVDPAKKYTATFEMAKGGEFTVQLYADKAPITVNSFVFLARDGYFNCLTFHRVLEGFMAQGGDPTGAGSGGPGYEFENEVSDLTFDKAGVVAMANAGPNTNGSQFFITFGPTGLSPNDYTIFGQVISGMDVVNAITRRDPQTNPNFTGDMIQSVTIAEG